MMIRMTHQDLMNAYATCKHHFSLKALQRDVLDGSVQYLDIMIAVHQKDMESAKYLLQDAGVLKSVVDDLQCCETPSNHKPWCLNK